MLCYNKLSTSIAQESDTRKKKRKRRRPLWRTNPSLCEEITSAELLLHLPREFICRGNADRLSGNLLRSISGFLITEREGDPFDYLNDKLWFRAPTHSK
jgi:hypothetical protein